MCIKSGTGLAAAEHARDLGCDVVFLSRDTGYYPAHGGRDPRTCSAITEIVQCETNVPESVAATLASHRVDGVLSAGEHHVEVAARVAACLGVAGLSVRAAVAARDKSVCLADAAAGGVLVPRHGIAGTAEEAVALASRIGYPCVVKPVDGTASAGVRYCTGPEDAGAAARRVLAERTNARGQVRARKVLVCEYVVGHEVSVEVLAGDGKLAVIGVTDKQAGALPWFVETGHTYPSVLPAHVADSCVSAAVGVLESIGFDIGMAHVELRMTDIGPFLMEVNARPPGDHITDLIRLTTGADPLQAWVRVHAGMAWQAPPSSRRGAAIRYLLSAPGRVRDVHGAERALTIPGVADVAITVRPGDMVATARSSHDRTGYVIAEGDSPVLAERTAALALSQLMVSVAPEAVE
jgi:biotin carboxylase